MTKKTLNAIIEINEGEYIMFKALKKMNLPNKLTMLRIILVPLFIILLCVPASVYETVESSAGLYGQITTVTKVSPARAIVGVIALIVYIAASVTDTLDGMISRKKGIVTKFGKIMDPLADKLLVSAGFIMLTGLGIMPAAVTAVIVFRDFFVTALRTFGADNHKDVAAKLSGKIKTVFQMLAVISGLLQYIIEPADGVFAFISASNGMFTFELIVNVFMSLAVVGALVATIWSFVDYFIRFKDDIDVEN